MPVALTDVIGREHRFDRPPGRVVSLVPSLTETLFDLGAGGSVAAVTDFCLFPKAELRALTRIGGTKTPRIDEIARLAPDLIYVNLEENLRRHAEALGKSAAVFATGPKSVGEVESLLAVLGRIHGVEPAAGEWIARLRREREAAAGRRFTFACPIWKDPWMWCGGDTYVSDLVSAAGGVNVLAGESRYPRRPLVEVLALAPEVIFLPDEPYAFTAGDARPIAGAARVVGPFPGHLFTWHGTRTVAGLRFLRESLAAELS
ncbi:MAG TPA: helical backbone metal receptor [Thermoanaerobaculia bacterium]|nr:helical backbone metal receptor [Thermoanaerobaculia bacterium]